MSTLTITKIPEGDLDVAGNGLKTRLKSNYGAKSASFVTIGPELFSSPDSVTAIKFSSFDFASEFKSLKSGIQLESQQDSSGPFSERFQFRNPGAGISKRRKDSTDEVRLTSYSIHQSAVGTIFIKQGTKVIERIVIRPVNATFSQTSSKADNKSKLHIMISYDASLGTQHSQRKPRSSIKRFFQRLFTLVFFRTGVVDPFLIQSGCCVDKKHAIASGAISISFVMSKAVGLDLGCTSKTLSLLSGAYIKGLMKTLEKSVSNGANKTQFALKSIHFDESYEEEAEALNGSIYYQGEKLFTNLANSTFINTASGPNLVIYLVAKNGGGYSRCCFCVVNFNYTGDGAMVHEIAHSFGGRHFDDGVLKNNRPFIYQRTGEPNAEWQTVMGSYSDLKRLNVMSMDPINLGDKDIPTSGFGFDAKYNENSKWVRRYPHFVACDNWTTRLGSFLFNKLFEAK